jgi:transposase
LALNRQVNVIVIDTNEFTRPLRGEVRSGIVRRRRWSAEEKGRIVAEAVAPGAVIAEVARRHDLTPQHLSNWIRAAKAGRIALPAERDLDFVPVIAAGPAAGFAVAPAVEILAGSLVVRIPLGCDGRMLENVLRAVKRALVRACSFRPARCG